MAFPKPGGHPKVLPEKMIERRGQNHTLMDRLASGVVPAIGQVAWEKKKSIEYKLPYDSHVDITRTAEVISRLAKKLNKFLNACSDGQAILLVRSLEGLPAESTFWRSLFEKHGSKIDLVVFQETSPVESLSPSRRHGVAGLGCISIYTGQELWQHYTTPATSTSGPAFELETAFQQFVALRKGTGLGNQDRNMLPESGQV